MDTDQSRQHELISAYLDGELTVGEQARVERLFREDPAARRVYEDLKAIRHSLQSLPRREVGRDLSGEILRQLAQRKPDAALQASSSNGRQVEAAIAEQALHPDKSASERSATRTAEASSGADRPFVNRRGILWSAMAIAAAILIMALTGGPWNPEPVNRGDVAAVREADRASEENAAKAPASGPPAHQAKPPAPAHQAKRRDDRGAVVAQQDGDADVFAQRESSSDEAGAPFDRAPFAGGEVADAPSDASEHFAGKAERSGPASRNATDGVATAPAVSPDAPPGGRPGPTSAAKPAAGVNRNEAEHRKDAQTAVAENEAVPLQPSAELRQLADRALQGIADLPAADRLALDAARDLMRAQQQLAETNTLIVQVQAVPEGMRVFGDVLARNGIAWEDEHTPEDRQPNTPQGEPAQDAPASDEGAKSAQIAKGGGAGAAPSALAHAARADAGRSAAAELAYAPEMIYVVASPRQIADMLDDLQQLPDAYPAIDVVTPGYARMGNAAGGYAANLRRANAATERKLLRGSLLEDQDSTDPLADKAREKEAEKKRTAAARGQAAADEKNKTLDAEKQAEQTASGQRPEFGKTADAARNQQQRQLGRARRLTLGEAEPQGIAARSAKADDAPPGAAPPAAPPAPSQEAAPAEQAANGERQKAQGELKTNQPAAKYDVRRKAAGTSGETSRRGRADRQQELRVLFVLEMAPRSAAEAAEAEAAPAAEPAP